MVEYGNHNPNVVGSNPTIIIKPINNIKRKVA